MAHKSETLCKYYLQGACALGRDCRFSHDKAVAKPSNICRYYAVGACAYGDRCRYDHVRPSPAPPQPQPQPQPVAPSADGPRKLQLVPLRKSDDAPSKAHAHVALSYSGVASAAPSGAENGDMSATHPHPTLTPEVATVETLRGRPLCPFHTQKGYCPASSCTYHHGTRCSTCGLHCLRHDDTVDRDRHLRECAEAADSKRRRMAVLQRSAQVECSICLELVLSKRSAGERRFGILTECTHPFCISCIRNWRGTSGDAGDATRACPICRKVSYFITPSAHWVDDPEEKRRLIDEYKGQLAKRPCKYYMDGESCPFGTSCFYRHVDKYGREEAKECKPRMYGTADGERGVIRAIRFVCVCVCTHFNSVAHL
eukprot:Opistho-2@79182